MAQPDIILDPDGDLLVILCVSSRVIDPLEEPESNALEIEAAELDIDKEAQPTQPDAVVAEKRHFKASSKHLTLASAYFKIMMDGPWREATEFHDDGLRHWVVEGFNLKAMTIVLSIIHGKDHAVPRRLSLDMLVEVARIVDYIKCHEVVGLHASLWIRHLEDKIPVSYNSELLLWICIAGVFRDNRIFKRCTRVAIVGNHNGIATLGLPILPEISDEINRRRVHHLDDIFASVYGLVDRLTKRTRCDFGCDALCLGVLTKYLHNNSLGPRPVSPYKGLSIAWAITILKNLPFSHFSKRSLDGILDYAEVALNNPQEPVGKGDIDWESLDLHCEFDEIIVTVHRLVWHIHGLDLEYDLGIQPTE
ncbi:hypothetical protein F5X98DRAFT_285550 [Xylaria grammica]|nr:hypothetical protein F5X98DRAFT_285550 [Xylaria grammica]